MTYKSVSLYILLLLLVNISDGQEVVWGSMPLDLSIDARSSALSGKLAANMEPDGGAAAYNPALVDSTSIGVVNVSYLNYFAGIQIGSVDGVVRNKGKHTIHMGARFSSFGKFEGYDSSGWPTGDFSGGDYFLQSGITWKLDSIWTAGITGWGGFRNLERENAGVLGFDAAVMGVWPEKIFAAGILISGIGRQFAGTGSQPVGWMPLNVQLGITKGFENAPFQLYLQAEHLEEWSLAPEGTYDDEIDPLTGETIPNSSWKFGDQFGRHLRAGVEINLGSGLGAQIGYDYRRRVEMVAAGRKGTNGFSIGLKMKLGDFDLGIARNTYHFAGSSTHLSVALILPRF
jgi:hypothetical protein